MTGSGEQRQGAPCLALQGTEKRGLRGAEVAGGALRGRAAAQGTRTGVSAVFRVTEDSLSSGLACAPALASVVPRVAPTHGCTHAGPCVSVSPSLCWVDVASERGRLGACVFVLFIAFIYRPKAVGTYIFKYKLLLYYIFPSHQSAARVLKYIPNMFYK